MEGRATVGHGADCFINFRLWTAVQPNGRRELLLTPTTNHIPMDFLRDIGQLATDSPALAVTLAIAALTTIKIWLLVKDGAEKAVDFTVEVPEFCRPGWTGEALKEPSIRVLWPTDYLFSTAMVANYFTA